MPNWVKGNMRTVNLERTIAAEIGQLGFVSNTD